MTINVYFIIYLNIHLDMYQKCNINYHLGLTHINQINIHVIYSRKHKKKTHKRKHVDEVLDVAVSKTDSAVHGETRFI